MYVYFKYGVADLVYQIPFSAQVNRYFILLFLVIIKPAFAGDNPFIRHYGLTDGLLTNTIYHVSQDKKGFLWFSTDAGVVKYNGSEFKNFRKGDGLTDKEILKTQEDSQGRVWIFSLNGNIHFYFKNKICNQLNTLYLSKIDSKEFIVGVFEDRDNALYFYTSHGIIYCLDAKNQVQKWNYPILSRLFYITNTSDGKILYITKHGLYTSDGFNSTPVLKQSLEIHNVFNAVSSHYLVWTITDELLQFTNEQQQTSFRNPLSTQKLLTAFIDGTGLMWIGTFDQGVYCLKGEQVLFNLAISQTQLIFEDAGKNIWITSMNEAIYKIHPGFTTITHLPASDFENKGISSIYRKESGGVWISNGSSIYGYSNGEIHKFYGGTENFYIDILAEFSGGLLFGKKNDAFYSLRFDHKSNNPSKQSEPVLLNPFIKGYSMSNSKDQLCIQQINDLFIYQRDNLQKPTMIKGNERIYSTTL